MKSILVRNILLIISFFLFLTILILENIAYDYNFLELLLYLIPLIYVVIINMYRYTRKKTSLYNIVLYIITLPALVILFYYSYIVYLNFKSNILYDTSFMDNKMLLVFILFIFYKDILQMFNKTKYNKKSNILMSINYIIIAIICIKFLIKIIFSNMNLNNSFYSFYYIINQDYLFILLFYLIASTHKYFNKI